jgi:hypothetical protein
VPTSIQRRNATRVRVGLWRWPVAARPGTNDRLPGRLKIDLLGSHGRSTRMLLSRACRPTTWLVVALMVSSVALAAAASAERPYPACFGAEARASWHACDNPKLGRTVAPTPSQAQITPSAPCTPIEPALHVCAFGVPAANAVGTVALVGDSHADQWRAALAVVAQDLSWQGISVTRPSCPFTEATNDLPEPGRAQCIQWTRGVVQWFVQNPEVSTVFVSDHLAAVVAAPRENQRAAEVAGYINVWKALPSSVRHIVVIRDIPYARDGTLGCVQWALAKRKNAGLACAVPRRAALRTDPAAVAADRLRSPRVQVINLTPFFCDTRMCYPVVGGALVYRDAGHLTRVFATTLGPFLLHPVGRLLASWYPPRDRRAAPTPTASARTPHRPSGQTAKTSLPRRSGRRQVPY